MSCSAGLSTTWPTTASLPDYHRALAASGLRALSAGLGQLAPRLLGPSAADQVAAAEQRARQLAGRNRVARELHDSIGHSLSVVSIQAAAAQRLLTADPAFADRTLTNMAETARRALEDLEYVLGILREPESARRCRGHHHDSDADGPRPAASRVEQAGASIAADITVDLGRLPFAVSGEAYRIVQEGLTNVLRHGGTNAATLRIDADPDRLRIEIVNALGGATSSGGGGRGPASRSGPPCWAGA
jgi:signal transduction histidine kinase